TSRPCSTGSKPNAVVCRPRSLPMPGTFRSRTSGSPKNEDSTPTSPWDANVGFWSGQADRLGGLDLNPASTKRCPRASYAPNSKERQHVSMRRTDIDDLRQLVPLH